VLKSIIPLKAACKKAFRGSWVQTVLLVKRPQTGYKHDSIYYKQALNPGKMCEVLAPVQQALSFHSHLFALRTQHVLAIMTEQFTPK
jgi:hypothetical protein